MCGNIKSKASFLCVAMVYVATHFLLRENLERRKITSKKLYKINTYRKEFKK